MGMYAGTESCLVTVRNLVMDPSKSSATDQVVFAVGSLTFNGELSSECETITVPNQNVSLDAMLGNIDSSSTVGGNNLTRMLIFSSGDV